MISRAGKKLYLNAMVGESIANDADGVISETSDNDASVALGIGKDRPYL